MSPQTPVKPARQLKTAPPRAKQKPAYRAAEQISELIGAIYDCALDPARWEPVLWEICLEFSLATSILAVNRLPGGAAMLQTSVGVPPDWLSRIPQYAEDVVAIWGGAERIQQYPIGEPIITSQAVGWAVVRENRYYREWAVPQGLQDSVAIILARDASMVGSIAFGRREPDEIGDAEVDGLRLLAPHFRRAVTISNLFDMKSIEVATFDAVLDSFAFGIVLVDEHLGIVHANQAAQALLAARDPVRSEGGALIVGERAAHAALQRAVRDAAGDQARLGAKGIGLPVRSADGAPFVVHVLPIGRGEMRRGLGQRASVALFVAPAVASRRTPADALALLYDLTPAELRVLELLAAGTTQAAIGQSLGIAPSTVKSHVLRLFRQDWPRRQVDLVKTGRRPVVAGLGDRRRNPRNSPPASMGMDL